MVYLRGKKNGTGVFERSRARARDLLVAGLFCGMFLCIATNFQQFGMQMYPDGAAVSGRAGFITTLYIVMVPLLGLLAGKCPTFNVWVAVVLATVGMFFLCSDGSDGGIYAGDIIILLCAVAFALQILCIDRFSDRVDGVKLSMVQFLVSGTLSLVLMLIIEKPTAAEIIASAPYVLYLGVVSCGIAYTFQIIGQQYSENPTVASILMSLESVFAALSGAIISGEVLGFYEVVGCVIMFTAIISIQLPNRKKG